jgi:hypothetical protein
MTSTIKVNTVTTESGSTLTLGGCGKTVALASGASQTGFGRTGTVDWQTGDIKTATFTAVSGQGFFCDTNGGAFNCNLPAGSAGAIVSIQDYRNTFDTAALSVFPNGSEKINGGAGGVTLNTQGEGITLVYIDSTIGWRSIQDNTFDAVGSNFIQATGGTETTVCTNFKVHTFTGPGTFTVTGAGSPAGSTTVDYLVIAGGGAGGGGPPSSPQVGAGGGGGAGGTRFSNGTASGCYTAGPSPLGASALPVSTQAYPITVGSGGNIAPCGISANGGSGSNSIFSSITSAGGGGAGSTCGPTKNGLTGGSGGGSSVPGGVGAAGNTPPTTPPQGNPGGNASGPNFHGGGGGATAAGSDGSFPTNSSGPGGAGVTSSITGSPVARGGGGGGGVSGSASCAPSYTVGTGGLGGGGEGHKADGVPSNTGNGTDNKGAGGGGGGDAGSNGGAGNGGSGVVIIRYRFQ